MVMLAAQFVLAASMTMPLLVQASSDELASHAEAAQQAEQRGDFSAAIREYELLVQRVPHNAELESNLGVALYFDHQWERSLAVLRKAVALNPKLQPPHLFSGLASFQLANPDAAAPELETAVRLKPSDVIAHTWLGYTYVAQSQYESAIRQFEEVTRLAPDNIDAWYALGQAWLELGKERTLALMKDEPDGGRAWQLAAEQYQLQGNRQKALEDYKQANERRPDIAEVRTALAALGGTPATATSVSASAEREDALYARAHEAEQKSQDAFEHVLSIAPDSYRAHQIQANAFVLQQQDDKAISEYRIVLASRPDLPGIHEAIGSALLRQGKPIEALAEFQAEAQLQPHAASVNTLLGQALLLAGKNEEAEQVLRKAVRMDRPPADAYRLLGKLDLHRNDNRAAVDDLNRGLSLNANDPTAYYLLARAYRGLGEKQQMNQALGRFEKLSKDVKQRGAAQRELALLSNTRHVDDEPAADHDVPGNP